VRCCGSPLFLKKRFGVGYKLVIAKKHSKPAPHIDEYIFSRIPNAQKLPDAASEMTF
jgi:hypothetical protein